MYTSWICLYDNRVYEGKITWEIPWTNKQLQLSLESFRDKLQPGAQERYQLRVSGQPPCTMLLWISFYRFSGRFFLIRPFHHDNLCTKKREQE